MDSQDQIRSMLDERKRTTRNGREYWMARDMQEVLGYSRWENFANVLSKAKMACESAGVPVEHHFRDTTKMITTGKDARRETPDCFLSRYGCYLTAMNGDPTKPEIGIAQTYFAVQARRQEISDSLTDDERRIRLRERVKNANLKLNSAAKQAGVQDYALFHAAGYRGLYGMGLRAIKAKKNIDRNEDLLDMSGRAELAANEFRITQTEAKLVRDRVRGQDPATNTHEKVGHEVRMTIAKLGGTMPEDLAAEPSIKKLAAARKRRELAAGKDSETQQ